MVLPITFYWPSLHTYVGRLIGLQFWLLSPIMAAVAGTAAQCSPIALLAQLRFLFVYNKLTICSSNNKHTVTGVFIYANRVCGTRSQLICNAPPQILLLSLIHVLFVCSIVPSVHPTVLFGLPVLFDESIVLPSFVLPSFSGLFTFFANWPRFRSVYIHKTGPYF